MEYGDYGATRNHTIEKHPTDPTKVITSSELEVSALEKIDWQGFSSDDLRQNFSKNT